MMSDSFVITDYKRCGQRGSPYQPRERTSTVVETAFKLYPPKLTTTAHPMICRFKDPPTQLCLVTFVQEGEATHTFASLGKDACDRYSRLSTEIDLGMCTCDEYEKAYKNTKSCTRNYFDYYKVATKSESVSSGSVPVELFIRTPIARALLAEKKLARQVVIISQHGVAVLGKQLNNGHPAACVGVELSAALFDEIKKFIDDPTAQISSTAVSIIYSIIDGNTVDQLTSM